MKFSVLLPTRNRVDLLRYAIESVHRQDWRDWEIVVSDNDSSEDVRGCVAEFGDERIRYFRTDHFVPVTDNWNNALRHAQGEYWVMLGDDDALLPGYFSTLAGHLERFKQPDVVYTEAEQFAYPNVIPGEATGFVQRGYAEFLDGRHQAEPFWLEQDRASALVRESMGFRVTFGFNMQHYLVSRRMVKVMSVSGPFFQSPYPDYYAANALLLCAARILVVPEPRVVIGISPKSFGYYYVNARVEEGDAFLSNVPEPDLRQRLRNVVLPGSSMNTSWLYAMELVKKNFDREGRTQVNYHRYRLLQVHATYGRSGFRGIRVLIPKLGPRELLLCVMLACVTFCARHVLPAKLGTRLSQALSMWFSPYPRFNAQRRSVPHRNILDLIEASQRASTGSRRTATSA